MPQVGIRTRFTLILSLIFVVAIIAAWVIFSQVLQQQAEDEITYQASVLIAMLNSVRTYTNTEVNPLLAPQNCRQRESVHRAVVSRHFRRARSLRIFAEQRAVSEFPV